MKYLVAVSGGVDSVVLLDMLATAGNSDELIVAHFDHGIRPDSDQDARFVAGLAVRYNLVFVSQRTELGENASEALARGARYQFLRRMAEQHQARIVTAHHGDDLLGSILINVIRGTGWRGLAPFGADDIERPLLGKTKNELYDYAISHRLEYVEDSSNQDPKFLRNQLTNRIDRLSPDDKLQLANLYSQQRQLSDAIKQTISQILEQTDIKRSSFTGLDDKLAKELLRAYIHQQSGTSLVWPAVERALEAVRHGKNGNEYQLGDKTSIWLKREQIIVGTTRPVLL